jgi:Fe-Mn family superoxide dismutase
MRDMTFELPDLPYAYNALEPHIDALTMEIHHSKHHNGYTNNLNAAIAENGLAGKSIQQLMSDHNDIPSVRNNGGGWWNHTMFWQIMSPNGGGNPSGDLAAAIDTAFGSFDAFKAAFKQAGMTQFGSGWAWLGVTDSGLVISSSPNQDNPMMDGSSQPILGLDVWEHAYYKKYGPGRGDYVDAWWNVVDWQEVGNRFAATQ